MEVFIRVCLGRWGQLYSEITFSCTHICWWQPFTTAASLYYTTVCIHFHSISTQNVASFPQIKATASGRATLKAAKRQHRFGEIWREHVEIHMRNVISNRILHQGVEQGFVERRAGEFLWHHIKFWEQQYDCSHKLYGKSKAVLLWLYIRAKINWGFLGNLFIQLSY